MPSYKLIRRILAEALSQKVSAPIAQDDFVFITDVYASPSRTIAELHELERLGYIKYIEPGLFMPSYSTFHWKRILALKVLRYIGYSIITPILVTLATMWVTGKLQLPG